MPYTHTYTLMYTNDGNKLEAACWFRLFHAPKRWENSISVHLTNEIYKKFTVEYICTCCCCYIVSSVFGRLTFFKHIFAHLKSRSSAVYIICLHLSGRFICDICNNLRRHLFWHKSVPLFEYVTKCSCVCALNGAKNRWKNLSYNEINGTSHKKRVKEEWERWSLQNFRSHK